MKLGRFTLHVHNFGFFALDGGSMFGSVPKNLWEKRIPADAQNRIRLATRSLIVEDGPRTFLIDCGMGTKWNEKQRGIYAIESSPAGQKPFQNDSVTDLILTHLHFDHAGGISHWKSDGVTPEPSFPRAQVYVQEANLANAQAPTVKERASYLPENVNVLAQCTLKALSGTMEICPGITVHRVDGHTRGQQWVEIHDGGEKIFFATDLIPTSHHLPLPFHMGYDCCAETLLHEKEDFLRRAVAENAIVFFQHDPEHMAATVELDARGHYGVREYRTIAA